MILAVAQSIRTSNHNTKTLTMKPYRSLSFLITSALCAFAFLFSTPAAEARVVGTLSCKGSVQKNKQPAGNGSEVNNGDIIQTGPNQTAIVTLGRGGQVFIKKMTRVRIFETEGQPMEFVVVFGGIDLKGFEGRSPSEWPAGWAGDGAGASDADGDGDVAPLPYLAAFGFGNFSFPSIGGGSATSSAVTSRVLPGGQVVFLNSLGQVVTTPTGQPALAGQPPAGRP
jgi:hypothetical protein